MAKAKKIPAADKKKAPAKKPPAPKMTRVRMLTSISGDRFSYHTNQTPEVTEAQAKKWVKCGFAERIPNADKIKADCKDAQAALAAANETIQAQAATIAELHDQVSSLDDEAEQAATALDAANATIQEQAGRIADLAAQIEDLTAPAPDGGDEQGALEV
ncbi:MAG: hypothetical protein Q9M33_08650 [Robiginitomaculum sp.]|nr:hypothetical protein [Robiginitomaculum sp.]